MRPMPALTRIVLATLLVILTLSGGVRGSTRTVETHFALSADVRSEFSTRFPLLSAGRIVIEADWSSKTVSGVPVLLTIELLRPDGSLAARNSGRSVCGSSRQPGSRTWKSSLQSTTASGRSRFSTTGKRTEMKCPAL